MNFDLQSSFSTSPVFRRWRLDHISEDSKPRLDEDDDIVCAGHDGPYDVAFTLPKYKVTGDACLKRLEKIKESL